MVRHGKVKKSPKRFMHIVYGIVCGRGGHGHDFWSAIADGDRVGAKGKKGGCRLGMLGAT